MSTTESDRFECPVERVMFPIRCLIVDDHAAVRRGVRQLLEEDPRFEVVDAVRSAEEAIAAADREMIDVAVVDYQLGGRTGLWVSRNLKCLAHPPAVLIYSAFAGGPLAAACVIAQVDGLVGKHRVDIELCEAICDVAVGVTCLPLLSAGMASSIEQRLNMAERMVFGMLRAGIATPDIADNLRCSEIEVQRLLADMLRKLDPSEALR